MGRKAAGLMYMLIVFITPIIVFLTVTSVVDLSAMAEGLLCSVSVFLGFGMAYLVYWIKKNFFERNIEFSDIKQEPSKERYEETSERQYSVETVAEKKKERGSFLDFLKGKKRCETCGTELEYKEGMDSYYCPVCHEYK